MDEAQDSLQREYGFLKQAAGLVDHLEHTIVEVSGDRAAELMAGLLTNDIEGLAVDRALYSLMLTPKGRPVAEMRVVRRSGAVWLDIPDACLEPALAHLGRYLPPRLAKFQIAVAWRRLSVVGPLAARALESHPFAPVLSELDPLQAAHAEEPPLATVVRREPIEGPGFDLYVTDLDAWRELLGAAVGQLGGGPVGPAAYDAWRIERGVPEYGTEIDLDVLPQETGQEKRAISFTKGCYTGQEVVARIHYRGHVNRILRGLRFDGPPDAAASFDGAELYEGDRSVGRVTSVAVHPALGAIGLGYVRREVEPPAKLAIEPGGPAVCAIDKLRTGNVKRTRKGPTE